MIGDLSTAAGVLRFCELKRAEVVRCFERLGCWDCNGEGQSPREAREALPPRLADAPDRREFLWMRLEHSAAGARVWAAEIKRDPARVEPWADATPTGEFNEHGNLVNTVEWRS